MADDGTRDMHEAADDLASRLPDALAVLARLAFNYAWSWSADGHDIFRTVDPHRWGLTGRNPVRLLQEAPVESLDAAADDDGLLARARALEAAIAADRARPAAEGPLAEDRPVAFLCAEYGVHASLPVYSGGLGALAGDVVKEASDRALPMVAVGLMYRKGYFRQDLDRSGLQREYWVDTDPERLPMALVTRADDGPLTVTVPIRGREVVAQVWRADIGRVPLYLLDAERRENTPPDRWITSRLYVGDRSTRQAQYTLLGVGAVRALAAMGITPGALHLNEGHAALAPLELAAQHIAAGADPAEARARARAMTAFTTHTPVAAGNDTYGAAEVLATVGDLPSRVGLGADEFLDLGRTHPGDRAEPFGVTQLGLRVSASANGVSRRHGEVAREMWREVFPDAGDEVPIGHITNGVHLPTWMGSSMRALLGRHLGEGWLARAGDPATWEAVDDIPARDLWQARCDQRSHLVEYVRTRSAFDRLSRGEPEDYVLAALEAFDPELVTIGFARRIATYKRLHLISRDPERALRLLDGDRPAQILLAGKAHPADDEAKALVQRLFSIKGAPHVGERVVFLHDYDLTMAAELVRGCDVWVNLPRPPLEASGTSGMKSAMNGGLQLSVLDGWWAEGYDGRNGWAIDGTAWDDAGAQDDHDAAELYRILEDDVLPRFYERDADGVPTAWVEMVRASLRTNGPAFSATRMLGDYRTEVYSHLT